MPEFFHRNGKFKGKSQMFSLKNRAAFPPGSVPTGVRAPALSDMLCALRYFPHRFRPGIRLTG